MSTLRDAFDELAGQAPSRPDVWAEDAIGRARRHRRASMLASAAVVALVLVGALSATLLGDTSTHVTPAGRPGLPTRFDPPTSAPPSVLTSPIRAAAALAYSDVWGPYLVDLDGSGARAMPYDAPHHTAGEGVTFAAGEGCGASLSPDGTRLAWVDCGDGPQGGPFAQVETLVLATGQRRPLPVSAPGELTTAVNVTWSSDNALLGVVAKDASWVVTTATGVVSPLPDVRAAEPIRWAPHGHRFAVRVPRMAHPTVDVYDGKLRKIARVEPLAGAAPGTNAEAIGWGPDDETLAAVVDAGGAGGARAVMLASVTGAARRRIALTGDLDDPNRQVAGDFGWRDGRAVLQLTPLPNHSPVVDWLSIDPDTGHGTRLFSLSPGVVFAQIPLAVLASAPLVPVSTPAPDYTPPVAPTPPSSAPPHTPLPPAWTAAVSFAGVTLPVPPRWTADKVSTFPAYAATACVHAPGADATTTCKGGILIRRVTAESSRDWHGEIDMPFNDMVMGVCPTAQNTEVAFGSFEERIDGRPATGSLQRCGKIANVSWTVPHSLLTLRADVSTPDTIAAVRAARIATVPLPTSSLSDTNNNGVRLRVPLGWNSFGRASECLGPKVGTVDSCPLDGILVRGRSFFTYPRNGGPVTPAPASILGYVSTKPKLLLDIPSGCQGLAGLNYVTRDDTGVSKRTLVTHDQRTISGRRADYWEWSVTCAEGKPFTWRRWWVPAITTMFDSYDRTAGAARAAVDRVLDRGVTWSDN